MQLRWGSQGNKTTFSICNNLLGLPTTNKAQLVMKFIFPTFFNFFVQAIHQFLTMHQIWRQPTAGNGHYMVHLNENLNESVISANLYVMISVIPVFHISHWLWHFPWKSVEPWKRWNCLSDQVFDQVFVQITNCICPNAEMYLSCTAWVVGNLGSTGWWRPKRGSNRIYDLRPRQPATLHPLFFSSKRSFQTSF